jgi:hypothetical protein
MTALTVIGFVVLSEVADERRPYLPILSLTTVGDCKPTTLGRVAIGRAFGESSRPGGPQSHPELEEEETWGRFAAGA